MSSNSDKILQKYEGGREEGRDKRSRAGSLEFHYTKKHLAPFVTPESRVIEIGCGTGYYGMHFGPLCAGYRGIDLTPDNIAVFKEKIASAGLSNVTAETGDAVNLENVTDGCCDVSLCLGPMYHLSPEERDAAFSECARITENGGIAAFAYISKLGVYAGACSYDRWRNVYPNGKANEYCLNQGTDDANPDVFYFTTPEEMEAKARAHGFEVIKNCGLDFMLMMAAIEQMTDEQFTYYMELADQMAESRFCTGLANHALLICRKKGPV